MPSTHSLFGCLLFTLLYTFSDKLSQNDEFAKWKEDFGIKF